jgi:hypothetical protein
MLKLVLSALRMVLLTEAVHILLVRQFINERDQFVPNSESESGADAMLAKLQRWTSAMHQLRAGSAQPA